MSDQARLAEIKERVTDPSGDNWIAVANDRRWLLALCERQQEELDQRRAAMSEPFACARQAEGGYLCPADLELDAARELLAAMLEESTYREDEQDETVFARARVFLSRSTGADDGK